MSIGKFISAVRVTGPAGAHEPVNAWCQDAAAGVSCGGNVYRYRLLNHPVAMVLVDSDDAMAQGRAIDKLEARQSAFGRERFSAGQIAQAIRPDSAPDPRDYPLLYAVWFTAPDNRADELHRWYDEEHVPMLMACPSWMAVRRFQVAQRPRHGATTFLALHYLSDVLALSSPERDASRRTAWRDRMAREEWFRGTYQIFLRERDL